MVETHPLNRRELAPAERLAWVRLARSPGVGSVTFVKLLERYGTATAALKALPGLQLRHGTGSSMVCSQETAERELHGLDALGARLLALVEPAYPERLRHIPDAPPVLAVRGRVELLGEPAVAIVGARNASGNGRLFAHELARELAAAGLVVVSGLARGIDTAVHEGVLAAGGATVAAVACGVDLAYPPENAGLAARIAETGAMVSDRPLGAEARAKDFPRRNRIIAGLSLGVVVVEAAPGSGSLITARLAAEQGREVMAVPGTPLDPRHRGTNRLLRDGAHLVESAADVLAVLRPALRERTPRPAPQPERAAPPPTAPPRLAGDALFERVQTILGLEPLAVDELIRQCQGAPPDVQAALLELELVGRLERHPGNRVSLRAG